MPRKPKPPLSAWIVRERKRLGLKPPDLAARLTAMGLPVADGTPRTWEAGRSPSIENIEGLERIFGTVAPTEAGEVRDTSSPADQRLYQLLEEQTRAFNRLAAAIERMVAQPLVVPPEVAEAMHRAVAELEPPEPGTSSPPRRSDHPTSEGTPHTGNPGTGTTAPLPSGSRHP